MYHVFNNEEWGSSISNSTNIYVPYASESDGALRLFRILHTFRLTEMTEDCIAGANPRARNDFVKLCFAEGRSEWVMPRIAKSVLRVHYCLTPKLH